MKFKYLKSKEAVFESWLNPILNGDSNSNILPPGSYTTSNPSFTPPNTIYDQPCQDMIDKPAWLDNDPDTTTGDVLSIGAYYINGIPLSRWGTHFGGSVAMDHRNTMQNWYYIDAVLKKTFPDGLNHFINKPTLNEINISNLTIIKMTPQSNGVGFNLYCKFNFNEKEIWGKFIILDINVIPVFVCEELNIYDIENKIKIVGKIWNYILNWFKPQSGIYKCIAKNVLAYTEFGQLKSIEENNIIEVIKVYDNKIKFIYNDNKYIIKDKTYLWFNWYFMKK